MANLAVADAPDRAVLQHAQQLGLHRRAGIGDLVEEQRAAVGDFEQASAIAVGAGERAAHVAEQLALEQRLGYGAAIDRDERARLARTVIVQRARDQLLAGPALADQHDR